MPSLRMDYVTCTKNATGAMPAPRKLWLIFACELHNPRAKNAEKRYGARKPLSMP
jgi:hypothetical protein